MILYKYVVPDRVDVLENGEIRFTQASSFNDPFETLPLVDSFVERSQIDETITNLFDLARIDESVYQEEYEQALQEVLEKYEFLREIEGLIRQYSSSEALKLGQAFASPLMKAVLGLDLPDARATVPLTIQKSFSSRMGTLCLTEKPDNLLMWSHYTDSHKGS